MTSVALFLAAFLRRPFLAACLLFVLGVVVLALFGVHWTGYGYADISDASLQPPSWAHWCGTDLNGRDLLTRTLYGARMSLLVAALGTIVSLTVGVTYGMISGYAGGRVDVFMMRVVDVLYSLPNLILVIVLVATLEGPVSSVLVSLHLISMVSPRIVLLVVFLGLTEWLTMARIVRGQVLALKEQAFIQASVALGQSSVRILFHHLLPNLTGIIVVYLTLTIPAVMIGEAFLSFLGLGVQPPQASWGTLIADGAFSINPFHLYWWLLVFPGALMTLTLLALNFLGDGLRDTLDPRVRK